VIDLVIGPRQSGKTEELKSLYRRKPGIFVVHDHQEKKQLQEIGILGFTYRESILQTGYGYKGNYNNFYFDEFFHQDIITFEDIVALDAADKNIHIRGTPMGPGGIPIWFDVYMKEKYPESMI